MLVMLMNVSKGFYVLLCLHESVTYVMFAGQSMFRPYHVFW